ncbi:histidinol-phosphate transaminase [uncultured Clostridium sp.]|uniref:histidinol-phosphate transaminase n=1 Tax=uncultured Clostridium sp. TaxID=59620 RepID=UPI0026275CA8|nr:histidinol-phosphate transaminase [uncultured Clostridium sp.]
MEKMVREEILNLEAYVAGKPIDELKRELGIERVVKMASNENPYGCSLKAKEKLKEVIDESNLYPDSVSYEFKNFLAKEYGIEMENIFCGAGSDSLIKDICATFLNKDDEAIMGDITFPRYKTNTILMGGKAVEVPLKNYKLDIEKMVDRINEKTKIIWLCNPNNPTGTIFTRAEFEKVLCRIRKNILIIMDEAYIEFKDKEVDMPDSIELFKKHKNIMILRTFSKAYGLASLRFGYGIGDSKLVSYLNRVINPFDTNLFVQKAALEAFKDKEHLQYVVEKNREQKEYLERELTKLGLECIYSQANFIMVKLNCDDKKIHEYLLSKGFIIRPGFLLGMPNYLRISIGKAAENKEFMYNLEKALEEIKRTKELKENSI